MALSATSWALGGAEEHDENAACSYSVHPAREADWTSDLAVCRSAAACKPLLDGAVGCNALIKHPRRSAWSANKNSRASSNTATKVVLSNFQIYHRHDETLTLPSFRDERK